MNVTLKNLTKLRIAGLLSEAAGKEVEKNILSKMASEMPEEPLSEAVKVPKNIPLNS